MVKKNEGNSSEDQEATKMHEMATISILRFAIIIAIINSLISPPSLVIQAYFKRI